MRTIISYDIGSDKRRRKVVKLLEGLGYRVQYSVFECELSPEQLRRVKEQLRPLVQPETMDSIRFYGLCQACASERIDVIGNDREWSDRALFV